MRVASRGGSREDPSKMSHSATVIPFFVMDLSGRIDFECWRKRAPCQAPVAPIRALTIWLFLFPALTTLALAQPASQNRMVFKGQQIEVIAPGATPDGLEPSGPARLCLWRSPKCFSAPKNDPQFGFSPKAEIVRLSTTQQAVLFSAVASAGGSGTLTMLALLDLENGNWENLLPPVAITNQGQYIVWRERSVSNADLFVTADFIWGEGETHFSEHRFRVTTYAFNSDTQRYSLRDRYVTRNKHPSLDEVDEVNVLDGEKPEILHRLLHKR